MQYSRAPFADFYVMNLLDGVQNRGFRRHAEPVGFCAGATPCAGAAGVPTVAQPATSASTNLAYNARLPPLMIDSPKASLTSTAHADPALSGRVKISG